MSIVLAIIGVVTASGMTIFASSLQKRQYQETQFKLRAIQQALLNYRVAYNRIPCPADITIATMNANFGVEASTQGDCYNTGAVKANFAGTAAASGNLASFVRTDTTTTGTWSGTYGSDGYYIQGGPPGNTPWVSAPSYGSASFSGALLYTWEDPGTTGTVTRDMQKPSLAARIAACWYTPTSFTIDVNLTDGLTHQISLYLLDWDVGSRSETIQVVDGVTSAVLDTQAGISSFTQGVWKVWNIRGHVKFYVNYVGGFNAVLSGVFFDSPASSNAYPVEGMIPVKTLRLPDDYAFDGWGRRILYAVYSDLTASGAFLTIPATDSTTRFTVNDAGGAAKTTKAGYVVLSTGPNGHGGYGRDSGTTNLNLATSRISIGSNNADEKNNCDCDGTATATGLDGTFVQKSLTLDPTHLDHTYDFDDLLVYGTRSDLRTAQE